MEAKWRLIHGITGNVIWQSSDEKTMRDWLEKQISDHPNGYYQQIEARIERESELIELEDGQVDLFELI